MVKHIFEYIVTHNFVVCPLLLKKNCSSASLYHDEKDVVLIVKRHQIKMLRLLKSQPFHFQLRIA